MLINLKAKVRSRWSQIKKKSQRSDNKYLVFEGSHENYLRNGAWVLEESISLFHGKANPIFHVSVSDMNNMNVEGLPYPYDAMFKLYKGSWKGRDVCVKKPYHSKINKELFLREIVVAAQMATHNNVHKLLGCCLETECPVLIYEWIEIETLEDVIISQNKRLGLEWKDRLRIAWEISHVVAYLHNAFPRPIIHKNLTLKSVFLNQDNVSKLSDFSLCVPIPKGEEFVQESVISGTMGYLDPEYLIYGKLMESADVYSFGMLLLALLTGKRPMFSTQAEGKQEVQKNLLDWVQNNINDNNINNVVDPALIGNGVSTIEDMQLLRASIHLAFQCLVREGSHRPSMVEVATMLKNMIKYPESILDSNTSKKGSIFRTFRGSKENFVRNETLVIQESMSLFHGKANPVRYFSVDDLNSMNVHFSTLFSHEHFNWYQGSWEGIDVVLKISQMNLISEYNLYVMYAREIVVATQMAAHDNVHKLIGCCLETVTPVLVYEWVSCETLEDHIKSKEPPLKWKDRLRIAREICHVVSYLHSAFQRPIVHGFLNSKTIFLDQKRTAKLHNFFHSIERVAEWTDVYSFGILFLHLIKNQAIIEYQSPEHQDDAYLTKLINLISEEIGKENFSLIVDPAIIEDGASTTELRASIELALKCTMTEENNRPTMEDIATELNNIINSSGSFSAPSSSCFGVSEVNF